MSFEYAGYLVTFIIGLLVLLAIALFLLSLNKWVLNQLLKSLGGWRALNEFRNWKRNKEAYFVSDREKWIEKARAIARGHTLDPESYYTEITIQAICTALQKGELDMPSPTSQND